MKAESKADQAGVEEKSTISLPTDSARLRSQTNAPDFEPVLIVLAGLQRGRRIQLDRGEMTLGRSKQADIAIEDDGISRAHLKIMYSNHRRAADEPPICYAEDLGSRNGTEINGRKINGQVKLRERDRITIGRATFGFFLRDEEELRNEQSLFEKATRDALTGLNNRHRFLDAIKTHLEDADERAMDICLTLIDIDHFKKLNDTYGHDLGDHALKHMASMIHDSVRATDLPARWGGEEFVIVLPETKLEKARILAERFRERVEATPVPAESGPISFTVSQGLTQRRNSESFEEWFKRADELLYAAKEAGRNRVETE